MKVRNRREAADFLGVNERTLDRWLAEGTGPEFVRLGERRRGYTNEALQKYLADRTYRSRADELSRNAA